MKHFFAKGQETPTHVGGSLDRRAAVLHRSRESGKPPLPGRSSGQQSCSELDPIWLLLSRFQSL